jgi:hypothetical protein
MNARLYVFLWSAFVADNLCSHCSEYWSNNVCDVTLFSLVCRCREDGGNCFFRNVDIYLQITTRRHIPKDRNVSTWAVREKPLLAALPWLTLNIRGSYTVQRGSKIKNHLKLTFSASSWEMVEKGVPLTSRIVSPGRKPTRSAMLPSSTLEMYTPTPVKNGQIKISCYLATTRDFLSVATI